MLIQNHDVPFKRYFRKSAVKGEKNASTVKARYNELLGSYKNMFVIDQVRYIEW